MLLLISSTRTPSMAKVDGSVKSPISALCCILRHCGVGQLRLIPQDLHALISNIFRNRLNPMASCFSCIWLALDYDERVGMTIPDLSLCNSSHLFGSAVCKRNMPWQKKGLTSYDESPFIIKWRGRRKLASWSHRSQRDVLTKDSMYFYFSAF